MGPTPAPEAAPGASSSSSSSSAAAAAAAEDLAGGVAAMTREEWFTTLRGIEKEYIVEDELMRLLNKPDPVCYDGFEPWRMHIAQVGFGSGPWHLSSCDLSGVVASRAGCRIADWFAQLNNKMGGDLKKILTVGRYMIEIWKDAGMNLDGVEFLWSSEEINKRAHEDWPLVMDIARKNNVKGITRCCQIMGRSDQEELTAAQIFYPCMQCADIFFLKADICQLGMDQRKVNMLAREYCDDIKRKNKPIILSHHMLPGFKEGQEKMSKSDPSSAIFMEDDEAQVNVKIKQAFCPPKIVEGNPCLEYIKYIVFPWFGKFEVIRKENNCGNKTFLTMDELISDYESGALHPADVKPALAKAINEILQPVRDHFNNNSEAKVLLNTVKIALGTSNLVTIFSPTEKHNPLTTKASDDQNVTECYVATSIPSEKLIMGPTPAGLGVVIRLSQHRNHRGVQVKAHVNDPADNLAASALAMQFAVGICRRLDLEEVTFPSSANKKAQSLAKQARQSLAGKACEFTCNNKSHAGSCPVLQALHSGQWEEGFSLVSVLCF